MIAELLLCHLTQRERDTVRHVTQSNGTVVGQCSFDAFVPISHHRPPRTTRTTHCPLMQRAVENILFFLMTCHFVKRPIDCGFPVVAAGRGEGMGGFAGLSPKT